MAYNRVNWEDAPSTKTPVSAENLNKMDAGIFANDKKLRKAISIKQEVDDSAENIDSTLIKSLPAATSAEDTDIMILENATKTQKITWGTILNLIKAKLGIGTAANLQTTSKEIVGAVNELNSKVGVKLSNSPISGMSSGWYIIVTFSLSWAIAKLWIQVASGTHIYVSYEDETYNELH